MTRNSSFSSSCSFPSIIFLLLILLLLLLITNIVAAAVDSASCKKSCGSITNIGFPFSLNNSLSGIDPSCPSSYMDNPNFQLFCNHTEGKLYALENSEFTTLEVISIENDSLIVRVADPSNMGRAEMTPNGSNCTGGQTNFILLPPVQTGPYVISDENKLGSFGCTEGVLKTSDVSGNSTDLYFSDHAAVGGCSVLFPDNRNNPECGNRTCCIASLPPAADLHVRYAFYGASYSFFEFNATDPECSVCSNNYASLFYPNSTDFDDSSFPIKILWAIPVNINDTITDPTSVVTANELNPTKLMESPNYACTRDNSSDFIPVPELPGYRCKCKTGFVGDGYTNGTGCTGKIINLYWDFKRLSPKYI